MCPASQLSSVSEFAMNRGGSEVAGRPSLIDNAGATTTVSITAISRLW
ncbi:BQ5605_C013g07182 [Microbotryum silenes-dioicae]|uniref:BQ5605_C013g07182 protein n=1 Tax=Microbotryum silenes-dioicae TaxID=796604 RepID=A0A2X0LR41_9BASI|nr:BQ5605_C013g07182 [Microbotryum silenes-dioicae]